MIVLKRLIVPCQDNVAQKVKKARMKKMRRKLQKNKKGGANQGFFLSFESVNQVNLDFIFVVDRTLAIGGDDTQILIF